MPKLFRAGTKVLTEDSTVVTVVKDGPDRDGDLKVQDDKNNIWFVASTDVTLVPDRFTVRRTYREVVDAVVLQWDGMSDLENALTSEEKGILSTEIDVISNSFGIDRITIRADLVEAHRMQRDPRARMEKRIRAALEASVERVIDDSTVALLVDAALGE